MFSTCPIAECKSSDFSSSQSGDVYRVRCSVCGFFRVGVELASGPEFQPLLSKKGLRTFILSENSKGREPLLDEVKMKMFLECPLTDCNRADISYGRTSEIYRVTCPKCGSFRVGESFALSDAFEELMSTAGLRSFVAAQNVAGREPLLGSTTWQSLSDHQPSSLQEPIQEPSAPRRLRP